MSSEKQPDPSEQPPEPVQAEATELDPNQSPFDPLETKIEFRNSEPPTADRLWELREPPPAKPGRSRRVRTRIYRTGAKRRDKE